MSAWAIFGVDPRNAVMDKPAEERAVDEDALLMGRVAHGDEAALVSLVRRWQNPLINFFYRSLSSRADADDLAQSVFIKLHRAAHRYQPTARFSTYLFHIARRVLLNEFRRQGRKPLHLLAPEDLPSPSAPDPAIKLLELEEIFQNTLLLMPENHRSAILLLRQQELSYAEIAEIMETTEGMVKTWIFRARQLLKEELRKTT